MQFYDKYIGHKLGNDFNSLGHRCKEPQDINLRNYILFVGDNITLGLGTPIEETYPYLVSKQMNMDYYNLAVFNGGLDASRYNLLSWYANQPRPRAIVICHEFINSFMTADQNFANWKTCDLLDERVQSIFDAGNTNNFFTTRQLLARKLIKNLVNIPIYQIEFKDKTPLFTEDIINIKYDGELQNHSSIAESLLSTMKTNARKALP
jgi:hypothetical protein